MGGQAHFTVKRWLGSCLGGRSGRERRRLTGQEDRVFAMCSGATRDYEPTLNKERVTHTRSRTKDFQRGGVRSQRLLEVVETTGQEHNSIPFYENDQASLVVLL